MKLFYIHGVGGDPDKSKKVQAFRRVADQHKVELLAPRFEEDWTVDEMVEFGVEYLLNIIKDKNDRVILIGSSRGAHIASSISQDKSCLSSIASLILLSPPIGIRPEFYGEEFPIPRSPRTNVFHGYMDDIIAAGRVFEFCNVHKLSAHFFPDGHRLEVGREAIALQLVKEIELCKRA